MPRSKVCFCCCVALVVWLLNAAALSAAVRYQIGGIVTAVADGLTSEFTVGESVSGHVLVEETPRPPCDICLGTTYDTTVFEVTFGGDYVIRSNEGELIIVNDHFRAWDMVQFGTTAGLGLMGAAVNGHVPDYFYTTLRYNSEDITSTSLLPQFAPGTSFFGDSAGLRFDVNDELEVQFRVTDFSVVPEPGSSLLFLIAAGGLLGAARGRR